MVRAALNGSSKDVVYTRDKIIQIICQMPGALRFDISASSNFDLVLENSVPKTSKRKTTSTILKAEKNI
jgi:hypothetical protein